MALQYFLYKPPALLSYVLIYVLMHYAWIDASFQIAEEFFKLPQQTKLQYQRNDSSENSGYVCLEQERYI